MKTIILLFLFSIIITQNPTIIFPKTTTFTPPISGGEEDNGEQYYSGDNTTIVDNLPYIIVLGFHKYTLINFIRFLVYLRIVQYTNPQFIKLKANVRYSTKLRILQNEELNFICYEQEKNDEVYTFNCNHILENNLILSNIEINLDSIKLDEKDDTLYSGPIAKITKNLTNSEMLEMLKNNQFTMKNCLITNQIDDITIKGEIDDLNIVQYQNKPYLLIVTENNELKNISCKFNKYNSEENNYELKCNNLVDTTKARLHESIAKLNDTSNVILSFKDSNGNLNYTYSRNSKYQHPKAKKGLSGGKIVAIILPCVAVIIAVTGLILFLGRKQTVSVVQNPINNTIGLNSSSNVIQKANN